MNKDINLEEITLDKDDNLIVHIKKKLKDFEILEVGKIGCYDYPSFYEGINKYISKHEKEWSLKNNETLGFWIKSRDGYNPSVRTFRTVVFYRIKDRL